MGQATWGLTELRFGEHGDECFCSGLRVAENPKKKIRKTFKT